MEASATERSAPAKALAESYIEMVREAAGRRAEVEALVFPDVRLTYADLLERATWRARELRGLGLVRGDTFGLVLPNSPELIEFLLGGAMIGAVVVPVNIRFKSHELAHVFTDAGLLAIVTTGAVDEHTNFKELLYETLPGLAEADDPRELSLDAAPALRAVILLGGKTAPGMIDAASLRRLAEAQPEPTAADAPAHDDPLLVMYTSGTTAYPKGCITTNGALVRNAHAIADRFQVPESDVWWDPLPMFHMGAILLMSVVFTRGATFVGMRHFDPEIAFDQFEREPITVLYPLFPTITLTLMHHPRFDKSLFGNVRVIESVSPPDVQRQIQDAFAPAVLVSAYGITELCGSVAYNHLDDPLEQRLTTCGHPVEGWEVKIVHPDTGETLPPGEQGELIARGPNRFERYFGDPALTEAVVEPDGWFHTGDRCSLDDDGRLLYHGRIKDMLKVGGENVSALEVESFLATHPAIKMAQVLGIPDDRLLEVAAAFVELVPGGSITEQEVVDFCTGKIARFKIPRHVRVVTEWPMSSTKVQKFKLREQLLEELGIAG
jgi:acyl-CoA synthetase (AMP-forming)/AMP-acid ligase II